MEEIWKDIPDYEGIYQASNLGRIADRYIISSDEIVKVFKLSNLPLFAYICDISGKMVYINIDNVLYIEEIEQ